jgi:hypothetical protein
MLSRIGVAFATYKGGYRVLYGEARLDRRIVLLEYGQGSKPIAIIYGPPTYKPDLEGSMDRGRSGLPV